MMIINKIHNNKIESVLAAPSIGALSLFDNKEESTPQITILSKLESRFNVVAAPKLQNLVHFQRAATEPVQRWFSYREGYSIHLVNFFIKELNISGNVFDPFSGSGTTLLAARNHNLQSYGIELNPLSTLVGIAENELYTKEDLFDIKKSLNLLRNLEKDTNIRATNFDLADKIFNIDILQSLLQLKEWLDMIQNAKVRNLFFMSWLSNIEQVSNIKKEGNGIKYKHRKRTANGYIDINKTVWEKHYFPENKFDFVKNKIIDNLAKVVYDVEYQYGNIEKKPVIFNMDCLSMDTCIKQPIQLTFYSPPYCNCFDYFEIHKVELWLGGFVKSKEELRLLRNNGFRSNTNSIKSKPINYHNEHIEKLILLFDKEKLWDKNIVSVVKGYFDDTYTLLYKIYNATQKNGYVGIVVGNSAYTGVVIPSDLVIAEIAQEIGFKVLSIQVTRHLTTSSQQKKQLETLKPYLRESIVLLQK